MNLSDLLKNITDDKVIQKWKELSSKEIKGFTKKTNPFSGVKISSYYLYIDTKSYTYSIELSGVKPNAGHAKGFRAPINKRKQSDKPIHIHLDKGWRTVKTERLTSPSLGTKTLDTTYYGVSGKPSAFFGLKSKGGKEAFGIIQNTAVPIYADGGLVEWISETNIDELYRILEECGFKAIEERK